MKEELQIKFSSISEVKSFVDLVSKYDYEIDLVSGRYVIDAKSIMGIFSLDLGKEIKLIAHTDNIDPLKEKIEKFLAK